MSCCDQPETFVPESGKIYSTEDGDLGRYGEEGLEVSVDGGNTWINIEGRGSGLVLDKWTEKN